MNNKYLIFVLFITGCAQKNPSQVDAGSFFEVANWQWIYRGDTGYVYISPQGDGPIKMIHYDLVKGDSLIRFTSVIQKNQDDLVWNYGNHELRATKGDRNQMKWEELPGRKYIITKINDSLVYFETPEGRYTWHKTLPLSTFLVRARYDYEHSSALNDSAEVQPKKLKHELQ